MRVLRGIIAGSLALIVAALSFLFFGGLLPMWIMMAVWGREAVQDASAHGGVILFATVPIAGFCSFLLFVFLTDKFYRRLMRT
jgi:hypothetical protein